MTTTTMNSYPNVPFPVGAVKVADWHDVGTPDTARYWEGAIRRVSTRDCSGGRAVTS